MTEIEPITYPVAPISDGRLDDIAVSAAVHGYVSISLKDEMAIRARILRVEADNAQLRALVVSSGDAAQHWTDEAATYLQRASEAEAQLAALQAERAWRPIETAPKDGTRLLLAGDGVYHGLPFSGCWQPSEFFPDQPWRNLINDHRLPEHCVTRWQPLPSLPTEETDNGA